MIEINSLTYSQSLDFLKSFEKSKIKLGLERIKSLLNSMGNPQLNFKTIHIAGTNGKGSTAAMLDMALANKGKFVGRFVSPHLITPRERIVVDGKPITRQWFSAASSYMKDLLENSDDLPSYFEYNAALAFYVFNFLKVDFGIIETGLGGRLDATTTMNPELCIITSISVDHSAFLGESISSIAMEKAGILKPGVPLITSAKNEALDVLKMKASSLSCPIYTLESMNFKNNGNEVSIEVNGNILKSKIPLKGSYQGENLALSMAAYYLLTSDLDFTCEEICWPARFEKFNTKPSLILDGAHNPDAIEKLLYEVDVREDDCLVFACMKDKDSEKVFKMLKGKFKNIILSSGNYHRFMKEKDFKEGLFKNYKFVPIENLVNEITKFQNVLVTGSIHFCGDFIKELVKYENFKKHIVEKEPYNFIFDSIPY